MTYVEMAREYRKKIEAAVQFAPDNATLSEPSLYPMWDEDWCGERDTIVRDEDALYRSLYDVITPEQNTKPSVTPDRWLKISGPVDKQSED